MTDKIKIEIGFLFDRFKRAESMDDIRGDSDKLANLQDKAEKQLDSENLWLPAS